MAPKDAPAWAHDRNELWNHAERAEKRKDAQLAREIEVSLPHELTDQQREWLVKDFAREAFVRKGYAVDIAIHAPDKTADERNHHAHIMVTMRTLGADGFAAKKDRDLNKPEQLQQWREQWAHLANRHLERHGHEARIDHRSLKEQGIDREPTIHLGYAANEMGQRGAQSDRVDALQAVLERNEIRVEMKALDAELIALERGTRHWEYSKTDPRYVNPILSSVVQPPPNAISSSEAKTGKQVKREEMERQWRSRDREVAGTAAAGGDRRDGAGADPSEPTESPTLERHGQDPPHDHGANRDPPADPFPPMVAQSPPQPPRSKDLLQTFKQQAKIITKPDPTPTIRRRRRRGDGDSGKQLTTAAIADSYVRLCHDPFQDIERWIAEDPRDRVSSYIISSYENDHDANTTPSMAASRRLCGEPLRRLQGGMDTEEHPRSGAGSLSAGSVADTDRSSRLRPPRAESAERGPSRQRKNRSRHR